MLQTAVHDWHQSHGGRMVEFAGWHMPIQYSSIVEEHHAVRRQAGVFDIAHMGRIWFAGPNAVSFLDGIVTNNVAAMKPGQVRYSLICREDGGILDDVLVYRFEDRLLLIVNGANREKIVAWLEEARKRQPVDMQDATLDSFMLALQGPKAQALLQPHVDCDLSGIGYYKAVQTSVFGQDAVLSRTGYTGEDGFELIVPNERALDAWTRTLALGEAGAVVPCGLGCRDTLRLEAAMPLYGHEMDETVDPYTAGLSFGVRLNKADFIGKGALEKLATRTDLPIRVGLQLEGKRIARQGAELFVGDQRIGHVTSGTFSPTLEASLAMGYVSDSHREPGTKVDVDIRGKREPARVVATPFYQRKSVASK